jgi:hypothetical protein
MSTLNVSNISDGTTTVGTSYVVNGSAKAWVNFNGTGTVAVRDSQGVSGLVDNGSGDYTSNFTSSFSAVDYTGTTGSSWDTVTSGVLNFNRAVGSSGYSTTSLFRMQNVVVDSTTNRTGLDVNYLYAVFHGDLA